MWLMEQPFTILAVGAAITIVLFAGLLKTGKSLLLYLGIAALLVTLGLLVLERSTITPREQVRATLFSIRDEIANNDLNALLEYISDDRPKIKNDAKKYMELVEVSVVDIKRNLAIELTSKEGFEIAEARFNCVLQAKPIKEIGGIPLTQDRFPFYFVVRFKRETDGNWRVRSYEMQDARRGLGPHGT